MTTVSYVEARQKIHAMQEAKDPLGNRLYDDLEIANYFGYESVERLNQILAQARQGYRNALIGSVTALKKAGKTNAEIAEYMNMTEGTVEVLLDSKIANRLDRYYSAEKARMEAVEKMFNETFASIGVSQSISNTK